jgi:hypothetical protein
MIASLVDDLPCLCRILISDLKPNAAAAADELPRGVLSSELVRNERVNSCRAESDLEMLRLLDVVALGDGNHNMRSIGLTRTRSAIARDSEAGLK